MANATVEKVKALGLRHGEKAVVGLAATLCVLFLFLAATRETISLHPEDVKKAADAAASNINRPQDNGEILKRLESEFLKPSEFAEQVAKQEKTVLVAANYKIRQPFVTFEPGGGLLRDMPELIAVSELYAYPGRGGVLAYELNADGERIVDTGAVVDEPTKSRRRKKRRRAAGGGMAMGAAAPKARPARKAKPKTEEELKKEFAEAERKVKSAIVGKEAAPKEEAEVENPNERFKETTVGKRWVVLTGTIDQKQLRENYLKALKLPEVAHPHYKRLDVERQVRQSDGSWSDWEAVDSDRNLAILDNLPEVEEEWAPEDVRFEELVDPLPFLKAGAWEHVHIASLVPKEKLEVSKPEEKTGRGEMPGMPTPSMMPRNMNSEMAGGSGMMMPGMGGRPGMGSSEKADFKTTQSDAIMLRSLDFTVEPDTTFRYRVRIVVHNPNLGREDVSPGIDTKTKLLLGPWSEPTEEVTMPADVTAYALKMSSTGKEGQVRFQVTRWDPADGVTVVKDFDAGPGEVVGEPRQADIPSSEGAKVKQRSVDFVSHQLVLDATGGRKPLPSVGASGAPFDIPPLSLLVRPDGAVLLRNSALDSKDEVRKDIDANYKKEKEESGKKRESSYGGSAMAPGMMPGMGGNFRQNAAQPGRAAGSGFR